MIKTGYQIVSIVWWIASFLGVIGTASNLASGSYGDMVVTFLIMVFSPFVAVWAMDKAKNE